MNTAVVYKTERKIGKTNFIITETCSPNARETIDEKLLKIMSRHVLDGDNLSKSYQDTTENALLCASE